MLFSRSSFRIQQQGFTLIETIVGIVVLAISFSILTTLIYPISQQSADQLHQVKAAELAQAMLNEIQNKAFDQKSDMAGGLLRCGEGGALACSTSTNMGPDTVETTTETRTETRTTFNDVDDYHGLEYGDKYGKGQIENSQGQVLDSYLGYAMSISVCNDADYNGVCDTNTPINNSINNSTAKLITVIITTPTDFSMTFSTYRANF